MWYVHVFVSSDHFSDHVWEVEFCELKNFILNDFHFEEVFDWESFFWVSFRHFFNDGFYFWVFYFWSQNLTFVHWDLHLIKAKQSHSQRVSVNFLIVFLESNLWSFENLISHICWCVLKQTKLYGTKVNQLQLGLVKHYVIRLYVTMNNTIIVKSSQRVKRNYRHIPNQIRRRCLIYNSVTQSTSVTVFQVNKQLVVQILRTQILYHMKTQLLSRIVRILKKLSLLLNLFTLTRFVSH